MATALDLHDLTTRRRLLAAAGFALGASLLGGCVVYPTGTYSQSASFDRSFDAAVSAMRAQGIMISHSDSGAGIVQGSRGGINVTAQVRPQADGTVRVQFDTSGATASDPTLIDRITASYNAHMGR